MIEVYTTTTCPYCKVLKDKLKKEGISFIEKNTDLDTEAMADMVSENLWSVPVIKFEGNFIDTSDIKVIKALLL